MYVVQLALFRITRNVRGFVEFQLSSGEAHVKGMHFPGESADSAKVNYDDVKLQ